MIKDAFVVMPNHVHGIMVLFNEDSDSVGAALAPPLCYAAGMRSAGMRSFGFHPDR